MMYFQISNLLAVVKRGRNQFQSFYSIYDFFPHAQIPNLQTKLIQKACDSNFLKLGNVSPYNKFGDPSALMNVTFCNMTLSPFTVYLSTFNG
jgi:hypothetical protein